MPSAPLERHFNRRQFLGSSALSTAGMAAGVVAMGAAARADASERVRLGVVGVRGQGKALASSFARFADCQVAALCDVDESKDFLGRAAEKYPEARRFTDWRKLLDDSREIDARKSRLALLIGTRCCCASARISRMIGASSTPSAM